jgi:hypothetical protein
MMFNFVISMLQYFHPFSWRKSEQNTIRIKSLPDVIVAACIWRLLAVCKTSVVGLSLVDNHMRPHCLGPSFRETNTNGEQPFMYSKCTTQRRDGGVEHGGTIAQSTTWVTTSECDKDSDIGDDYK